MFTITSVDLATGKCVSPVHVSMQPAATARYLAREYDTDLQCARALVDGAVHHGITTYQFTAFAGTRLQYEEFVSIQYCKEL